MAVDNVEPSLGQIAFHLSGQPETDRDRSEGTIHRDENGRGIPGI